MIDYNTAQGSGGGLYVEGFAVLDSVDVSYNEGSNSGAIHYYYGKGEIRNSKISHNQGTYNSPGLNLTGVNWGGGIDWESPGLILDHVEISNNPGDYQINITSSTGGSTINRVQMNNVTIV